MSERRWQVFVVRCASCEKTLMTTPLIGGTESFGSWMRRSRTTWRGWPRFSTAPIWNSRETDRLRRRGIGVREAADLAADDAGE